MRRRRKGSDGECARHNKQTAVAEQGCFQYIGHTSLANIHARTPHLHWLRRTRGQRDLGCALDVAFALGIAEHHLTENAARWTHFFV